MGHKKLKLRTLGDLSKLYSKLLKLALITLDDKGERIVTESQILAKSFIVDTKGRTVFLPNVARLSDEKIAACEQQFPAGSDQLLSLSDVKIKLRTDPQSLNQCIFNRAFAEALIQLYFPANLLDAKRKQKLDAGAECPITSIEFILPYITRHGYTYEKYAIETEIALRKQDPLNRAPLSRDQIYPNRALRGLIELVSRHNHDCRMLLLAEYRSPDCDAKRKDECKAVINGLAGDLEERLKTLYTLHDYLYTESKYIKIISKNITLANVIASYPELARCENRESFSQELQSIEERLELDRGFRFSRYALMISFVMALLIGALSLLIGVAFPQNLNAIILPVVSVTVTLLATCCFYIYLAPNYSRQTMESLSQVRQARSVLFSHEFSDANQYQSTLTKVSALMESICRQQMQQHDQRVEQTIPLKQSESLVIVITDPVDSKLQTVPTSSLSGSTDLPSPKALREQKAQAKIDEIDVELGLASGELPVLRLSS